MINACVRLNNPRTENMPQDSFRSVVYRSFVTCDDPKGIAEDATIRKSKTDSQKMVGKVKTENQRQPKNLINSSSQKGGEKKIGGRVAEELDDNPSSFQLMEVKKGAQKLNQVIDSWSKGVSFEGQPKDIAEDLLRGALDLQESLTMLGKLQEASQYMAKFKKKQKEKVTEIGIEKIGSELLENRYYQMGYQKPRTSVDGSSRDCYEELRDVIRDSFGLQNLLPNGSYEERLYLDRRKVELSPDIPSTSSSRSSVAYSYEFASSDSLSSKMPEEKPKGSNLIAKLMGLEDMSSKSSQLTPQKQLERDKTFNLRRPIFDIDLPMTRKPQFVVQKVDREPMTLDKIIEVMHSKGLLRSNKHQSHHSNTSYLKKRFSNDAPPIVLMKPHLPEEFHTSKFHQGMRVCETDMARNRKTKEDFPPKIKKLNLDVLLEEETSIKNLRKEKEARDFKGRVEKAEDELKIKGKSCYTKVKASASVSSKPKKMEAIEKKVDKIHKMAPYRKKPLEMENMKSTSGFRTHEQEKVTLSKQTKSETRSNTIKSRQVSPQKTTTANPIPKRTSPQRSTDPKKNVKIEKPVNKPLATNIEKNGCEINDSQMDLSCENESHLTMTDAAPAVQVLDVEKSEAYEVRSKDISDDNQHSLCEATLLTTEQDSGIEAPREANCSTSCDITESNCLKTRNRDAEELFDINAYRALVLQTMNLHDSDTTNSKLLLDCANELLEHKSLRQIPGVHPLLRNPMTKSRFRISADQLTKDVSDGIENLSRYCKCTKESPRADTIHGMLERDLWWKGVLGGAWDMGWMDGFSLDEVEEVVGDLDKLVLSELIENMLTDFLC